MIILGINGSPYAGHHDASACIVKNGEICVIAEEERFSRQKHAYDVYPHAAMQYCLAYMGITIEQVDHVVYGWDLPKLLGAKWIEEKEQFLTGLFPNDIFFFDQRPQCVFMSHHIAHAASTFWCSGFQKSSILIMDGQGESASGILAYGDRQEGIKILEEFSAEQSLGYLYRAASGFTGLGRRNPGKLMGLSSYGNPVYPFSLLTLEERNYKFKDVSCGDALVSGLYHNMEDIIEWWLEYFSDHLHLDNAHVQKQWDFLRNEWSYNPEKDIQKFADLAASVQNVVELVGCHLVREVIKLTGCPFVSLAGGVALNCSVNGKIALMPEVDDLFIFPASHDSGISVGAALQLSFDLGIPPVGKRLTSCYFGPIYDNGEIERVLQNFQISYKELADDLLYQEVANLLCKDMIVAIFTGKSEIGPRALGNRSIIAAPNSDNLRDRVNRTKGRELWRPLCPSVLSEQAHEFFHNAEKGSPFMLRFLTVKEDKKRLIPGVVHIDDTARVQLVESDSNFGKIIEAYRNISGLPMVLNTSFNLAGEPIAGSPIDALRSFFTSPIDALVLGNYLIVKPGSMNRQV